MTTHSITTTLMILAGSAVLAYAQTPAPAAPAPQEANIEAQALQPLQQDPQLYTGKLENGLSYMIRPTAEPAGRASIRLFVENGSLDESEATSGVSHFLEHLVFNGSRHYKRGELIPQMQKLGLGFGGDANAYTSLLHTVFMLDLPNLKEETVDFAMTITRDFADGATLEDEAIDKERGIVISELKSRDSEQNRTMVSLLRQMTEGSRVADFMPIGREEVIRNISYDEVRQFYKSRFVPERMTVIITGDVSVEQAEAWVKKYFGDMPKQEALPRPSLGTLTDTPTRELLISNKEQAHTNIFVTVPYAWENKADTIEKRVDNYPLQLAFAMFDRRMERILRKADAPFQSAGMDKSPVFRVAEPFTLSAAAAPEQWEAALTAVICELRKAIQYGFSKEEMEEAINTQLGQLDHAAKTWSSVSAANMASALVDCLDEQKILTTPEEDFRVLAQAVAKLSANPDLCREDLDKNFRADMVKLTMSGTLPEGITEAKLREVFDKAMQLPIEKPEATKAAPFAYENIGEEGSVVSRESLDDLGVTMIQLSNGIKVNLKPVDFQKGSIYVSAAIDGGFMQYGNHMPGLGQMMSSVMNQGGLEAHSADELESLLAGKQVGVGFSASQDRFTFSGPTNEKNLELQCKLIAANILHPGYRPDGETVLRRRLDTLYTKLNTTPDGAYSMQMPRAIFGDDTRFIYPTREQMDAVSTANVKPTLEQALNSGAMEVTIVGDFKVDDILPVITRTFGAMPQRNAEFAAIPEESRNVTFQPWGQRTFLKYDTELDKTLVTQIRPAGDGRDYRRNRRLQVLTSIVREKLFDGLRAVLGESYSPSVRLMLNQDFNNAAFITSTSAGVIGNREKVSAAMESICNGIGQGNITDEEVECAIRPIITAAEKNLRTTGYWLNNLAKLQSDSRQVDMVRNLMDDLRSITADEIRALAKEVYGKDNATFFFTVPDSYQEEQPAPEQTNGIHGEEYTVLITEATAALPEWKKVADTLVAKYPGATLHILPKWDLENCEKALRETEARYAAYVARPEEIGRDIINMFHRAARRVDDDMWGDCMWGVVTGNSAADAQRIAEAKEPLVIKRLLGTTNVHYAAFEHSCCITDWHGSPILEQNGYQEPTSTTIDPNSQQGKEGMQVVFGHQLSKESPELIVTSSHATQYNLEMPFGRGLILPDGKRFYMLQPAQFPYFRAALRAALSGEKTAMPQLAEKLNLKSIEPDTTTRVWLAAGNCLFGDVNYSDQSMAVTALSGYGCNQVVGYTVPSWYGEGGWGTLSMFVSNTTGTTLAEAWFLNNQFLLQKTKEVDEHLLKAEFNDDEITYRLQMSINRSGAKLTPQNARDAVGLVHDRDTVAFYGDPAWPASVDSSHAPAPYSIEWKSDNSFTITANSDTKGRCAVWFPHAGIAKGCTSCDIEGSILTDDFVLFPTLEMKKGEQKTVQFK